ncbi:hypothetical protein ScPMuIL_000665 [Solemya velum]
MAAVLQGLTLTLAVVFYKFRMSSNYYIMVQYLFLIWCKGHRLSTDVNGGASTRIAMQLMWNRTVNTKGCQGKNIEMDLQMEFFNRDYKEAIKNSGGNLTKESIGRYN